MGRRERKALELELEAVRAAARAPGADRLVPPPPPPEVPEPEPVVDDALYRSLVRGFEFIPPLGDAAPSPLTPAHPIVGDFAAWAVHKGVPLPAELVAAVTVPAAFSSFTWDAQAVTDTTGHVHVLVGVEPEVETETTSADVVAYFGLLLSSPPFVRAVQAAAPSLYAFGSSPAEDRVEGTVLGARWHDADDSEWIVLLEVPDAAVAALPVQVPAMVRFIRPPVRVRQPDPDATEPPPAPA
jgi:hypothetical protein